MSSPKAALTVFEATTNHTAAIATFRHLLRACHIAFRDDLPTKRAARQFAAEQFRANAKFKLGSIEAAQGIEHAQGVTQILRENVVQGRHMGGEKYKLNIHEHTQRLDNETAGKLKGTTKSFKSIKDAQF